MRFHSEFVLHKTKYAHMCTSVANSGLEFKPRPLLQQHCNLTSVPAFQYCSAPIGAQEKAQTVLSHYFWHWRWTNKLKLFWMQILHPTVCGTPWFSDTLSIPPSHNGTQILLSCRLYWAPPSLHARLSRPLQHGHGPTIPPTTSTWNKHLPTLWWQRAYFDKADNDGVRPLSCLTRLLLLVSRDQIAFSAKGRTLCNCCNSKQCHGGSIYLKQCQMCSRARSDPLE